MRPLPHVAWPPLSSCNPCTKTALGTCQWARRLSLLHSPPCPGLGPRDAGPGGGCLVPARPSACPRQRWPNRFHSNWQSQTQNLGEQRQGKRGCVCGLLWGVCRLCLFCSLLHAGVEDHPHLPDSPVEAARSPGLQLCSSSSEEDAEHSSSLLLLLLPPPCPHPQGEGGGPREVERQRAHASASWVLCWSLSVQGLAPARQRAGRVRLHHAHPCLSSGRMPLPCPQEWSFLRRERRRC